MTPEFFGVYHSFVTGIITWKCQDVTLEKIDRTGLEGKRVIASERPKKLCRGFFGFCASKGRAGNDRKDKCVTHLTIPPTFRKILTMTVSNWMCWEGGVDLMAMTQPGLPMPNIIVHVARMVHTPISSAPAGMILLPNPENPAEPLVMGFISTNLQVGAYFAPKIFAGTPFEQAPTIEAAIEIDTSISSQVTAKVTMPGFVIESTLLNLGETQEANRLPGNLPFSERSLEAIAGQAKLVVNGQEISMVIPPAGLSGGPAAFYSACGMYAR
jgi:hypothetical protein